MVRLQMATQFAAAREFLVSARTAQPATDVVAATARGVNLGDVPLERREVVQLRLAVLPVAPVDAEVRGRRPHRDGDFDLGRRCGCRRGGGPQRGLGRELVLRAGRTPATSRAGDGGG